MSATSEPGPGRPPGSSDEHRRRRAEWLVAYDLGATVSAIAEREGTSRQAVYAALHKARSEIAGEPPVVMSGDAGWADLSYTVRDRSGIILARWRAGWSIAEIATDFELRAEIIEWWLRIALIPDFVTIASSAEQPDPGANGTIVPMGRR